MITNSILKAKVLIIACIYTLNGCTQDTIQTQTIYDGCCGTEPKVYEIEDHKVYIPNVITPNGDGINDAFYPICNKMIKGKFAVANFKIFDDAGKLIFLREGLDITDPEAWGFKGIGLQRPYKPRNHEQFEFTGKFSYSLILAFRKLDNTEELIEVSGFGCVVRCDNEAHIIKTKEGCYFPIQGVGGIYSSSIFINEDNCIK